MIFRIKFGQLKVPQAVQWLTDNGSCYVARETVAFGRNLGLDIRTTLVRSPGSNGMAEAFVKTFERDYVVCSDLENPQKVMFRLSKWIEDYNEKAPHKALKMLSPREFIQQQNGQVSGPVWWGQLQLSIGKNILILKLKPDTLPRGDKILKAIGARGYRFKASRRNHQI